MKSKYSAYGARLVIGCPFFSNGIILTAAVRRVSLPMYSRKIFKSFK